VDPDLCRTCKVCLKIGCPALEFTDGHVRINSLMCGGCSLCEQICPFDAISPISEP